MFGQSLLQESESNRKPLSLGFSLAIQAAVIACVAFIPLLYNPRLPRVQLRAAMLAPLPPNPQRASKAVVVAAPSHSAAPNRFQFHPDAVARKPQSATQAPDPAPSIDLPDAVTASSGTGISLLSGADGPAAPTPIPETTVKPPAQKARTPGTIRLGGVVAEANLIQKVQPAYPPLARTARVSGTVEFTAVISREGRIQNLQLLHGHPLLVNAAQQAVLQWRYKPTLLNGQPVEVVTSIIVSFNLN